MSSILASRPCNARGLTKFSANCHKIESARLSRLLYLLLYQHILLHILNDAYCLNNDQVKRSQSNTNHRNHRSTSYFNSSSRNYHDSSPISQKSIPSKLSIEDTQVNQNLITGLANGQTFQLYPFIKSLPVDGNLDSTIARHESQQQYLPDGPPPFKPPMLALDEASRRVLKKLKQTLIFKRMYKPKIYYLYLDTLRGLTLLAENLSRKKFSLASSKYDALQMILNKLTWKGSQALKLKWPIILLNPKFLREMLSNPTFLVMLFHAVEVAYVSMPMKIWLRPLMKLIAQPSPESEEKVWWRRKRLYDTLNGHGASELQPNLKKIHFRNPGEPTPIAIPNVVHLVRNLMNRPGPNPAHHRHPSINESFKQISNHMNPDSHTHYTLNYGNNGQDSHMTDPQEEVFLTNQIGVKHNDKDPENAATTLVENETSDWPLEMMESGVVGQSIDPLSNQQPAMNPPDQEDWLSQQPNEDQLMSQHEFDSLDPREKDMVLNEARKRFEESKWTNELIKEHSDLINSFTQGYAAPGSIQPQENEQTNPGLPEPPKEEEDPERRYSSQNSLYNNRRAS